MREKIQKQDEEERRRRLEATKYQVSIDYDPHHVYEPTQAWTSRGKTPREESKNPSAPPPSILYVPHRATPSWRQ